LVGGGVVIDLINLQELKIDAKANVMTVGAGYRLVRPLYSNVLLLDG
jgi:hypothetical protein